jgi:hypothetical protein
MSVSAGSEWESQGRQCSIHAVSIYIVRMIAKPARCQPEEGRCEFWEKEDRNEKCKAINAE